MLAVKDVLAKVIVCDEFAYIGAGNITKEGLTVNREVCEISENEHGDVHEYVESEIGSKL